MRVHVLVHAFILPLFLCLSPFTCEGASFTSKDIKELKTTGHGKTRVLRLAAFLPYTWDYSYSSSHVGNGMEVALVMALEAINADPTVLADVELRLVASDSRCSNTIAARAVLKQMLAFPDVAGVIGDVWCSGATTGLAPMVASLNLLQVSGGAESAALSDKSVFPNFLRTVPPTTFEGDVFASLCAEIGLKAVGVVVDWMSESNKLYAQPSADAFAVAVADTGMRLGFSDKIENIVGGTRDKEIDRVVLRLLLSGVRVVYTAMSDATILYKLVCATHKQFVYDMGPEHNGVVWMSTAYHVTADMTDALLKDAGCTRDEWDAATRCVVAVAPMIDAAASPEPGGRSPKAWSADYEKRVAAYNTAERPTTLGPRPYVEMNYDAVWMWALALDKMLKGTATATAFPLSKLSFPAVVEPDVAGALKAHLRGTSFDGASGRVTIENTTQDRGSLSFLVVQTTSTRGETRPVAKYSQVDRTFSTTAFNHNATAGFNITWPTLDGAPPKAVCALQQGSSSLLVGGICKGVVPEVISVSPAWISPYGGDLVLITGDNFFESEGESLVMFGSRVCQNASIVNAHTITCTSPMGVGGPIAVQVSIGDQFSTPEFIVSYLLPELQSISTAWGVEGTVIEITGRNFVNNSLLRCRIGDTGPVALAVYEDNHHMQCTVPLPTR